MLAIILSACMVADPNVCKDYRISVDPRLDVNHCAMYAPPYFVEWAERHPGWAIKRWRCGSGTDKDI